jgi:hypothetical protein
MSATTSQNGNRDIHQDTVPYAPVAGQREVMTELEAKDLEQRTRELFTECLVSLGAVNKDMDVFTVSREDIERLVGE